MEGDGRVREALREELRAALKRRDDIAVAAIRSAIAAIDNAGAVAAEPEPAPEHPLGVHGVGAAEVPRRALTAAQMREVVEGEVSARLRAAAEYETLDRAEHARRLRAEAATLQRILAEPDG
jgi:uncharacterized protein YqeY